MPSLRTLAQLEGAVIVGPLNYLPGPAPPVCGWWVNFLLPGAVLLTALPSCNRQLPHQRAGRTSPLGEWEAPAAALHCRGDGITAQER